MTAAELFRAGHLSETIQALSAELRDHPADSRRRTFLFELLCFAGEFDRAAKHLAVLASAGPDNELGALLYRSALTAERQRESAFQNKSYPEAAALPSPAGTLNGKPFQSIQDADPRIGARLEVYVAGEYLWLPFAYIGSVRMEAPRMLRDLLWASGRVTVSPAIKDKEFGEVLLPALCPLSWHHPQDAVKLGRATDWQETDGQVTPIGQKLLLVDGEEEIPFLEIRSLDFTAAGSATPDSSSTSAA